MIDARTAGAYCRVSVIALLAALASGCGGDDEVAVSRSENPPPVSETPPPAGETPPPASENQPPALEGSPETSIKVGAEYEFQPKAQDPDGDMLLFGVDGKPPWAEFDSLTGSLTGAPGEEDVGTYQGIVVWVTDGETKTPLPPFDIVVEAPPVETPARPGPHAPAEPENTAPTISGSPATSVVAGETYRFVPQASDPDEDPLSFTIRNAPSWTTFDEKTGKLEGVPPFDRDGEYGDIVIAVSDGRATTTLPPFTITVRVPHVNSAPTVSGNPPREVPAGNSYSFVPTATDVDGDPLTFDLDNGPAWIRFDGATGRLSGQPADSDVGRYEGLTITVSDGVDTAVLGPFSIVVTAPSRNTAPTITGVPGLTVLQGQRYAFTPAAFDADDDELSFSIANKPAWARFDPETGMLAGTPDGDDVGTHRNIVISVSDGAATASLPAFSIRVDAANSAPTISGSPASSVEQGQSYSFVPNALDADADPLTFSIENRPSWAAFDTSTGRLSGTPGAGAAGEYSGIRIRVSDGSATASLPAFTITVTAPPNGRPTIWGTPASSVMEGAAYTFAPSARDPDGDGLTFSIANRPGWLAFDPATGSLQGTPGAGHVGTHRDIRISVSDGEATASLPAFSITVTAAPLPNRAPTISGNPPRTTEEGERYVFRPSATDPDGDRLTFTIANQPSWASFDSSTGSLEGTPRDGDAGTYNNVRITASDGEATASLGPFSITVAAPEPENSPPTISGSPSRTAVQGTGYSFRPTASDPDGDILTFRIANRPAWANFDQSTGQLSGTPGPNDVGAYSNIRISVTDGDAEVALPAFDIQVEAIVNGTATLTWNAPTERTDGSPLTNLAGYNIYWGREVGNYPNKATVGANTTTYVIENLAPGTWYFVTTAFDREDGESDFSNVASKTIR